MTVMQIGKVRMTVDKWSVAVGMAVRLPGWIIRRVGMVVMGIVKMPVLVFHGVMDMFMAMTFHEMQIKTDAHEDSCSSKADAQWL